MTVWPSPVFTVMAFVLQLVRMLYPSGARSSVISSVPVIPVILISPLQLLVYMPPLETCPFSVSTGRPSAYLRRAFGELSYAKRYQKEQGETGKERQQADGRAKKTANKAAAAVTATLASTLFYEAINFVRSLFLRKGKDYRDDEDELTAASIIEQIALDSVGDLAGMMVYGSELTDLLESWFLGKTFWGIEIPGGEQLNDVVEKVQKTGGTIIRIVSEAGQIAENGGDIDEYFRRHSGDYAGAVKEIAETVATYLAGFPVENIEKYMMGTLQAVSPEFYAMVQDYFDTPTKNDLKGLTGDVLKTRVGSILQTRNVDADEETAAVIAELYEAGLTEAMPTDTPSSISVNSEDRKLNAYQKQVYDLVWSGTVGGALDELVASEAFRSADQATQAKMVKQLYDYATEKAKEALFDDYEIKSTAEKADTMIDAGASAAEWAAWKTESTGEKRDTQLEQIISSGMSDAAKLAAIGNLIGTEMETDSGNPTQWAKLNAAVDEGCSVDDAARMLQNGTLNTYMKLTKAGLGPEGAYRTANVIGALEPEDGKSSVSDMQRFREIEAQGWMTEKEKIAAIGCYMGDEMVTESGAPSQRAKMLELLDGGMELGEYLDLKEAEAVDGYLKYMRTGLDYELKPETYIKFLKTKKQYDADGNGSYTQAEVKAAIDSMIGSGGGLTLPGGAGISNETAAALWQLANSSWKPAKNPYNYAVGTVVYDGLHAESEASGEPQGLSLKSLAG